MDFFFFNFEIFISRGVILILILILNIVCNCNVLNSCFKSCKGNLIILTKFYALLVILGGLNCTLQMDNGKLVILLAARENSFLQI